MLLGLALTGLHIYDMEVDVFSTQHKIKQICNYTTD